MPAGPEIQEFKTRVDQTIGHLNIVYTRLSDFADLTDTASNIVDTIDDVGDLADEATKQIDEQLSVLKATKLAGPLKLPSKIYEDVLKAVRPITDKIDKAVDRLNGKKDSNDPDNQEDGEGEFLNKLESALNQTTTALRTVASDVDDIRAQLIELSDVTEGYINALDAATSGDYGSHFDALRFDVDQQYVVPNNLAEGLEDLYNDIRAKVQGVIDIMKAAKVDLTFTSLVDMDAIQAFFDVMDEPLEIAAAIIKPIEPVLDAVGFLFDLVVGPVFDFITDVMKLDEALEAVTEDIRALLPDPDFLADFEARVQEMLDDLREFIDANFEIPQYLDDIETAMLQQGLGDLNTGPTGTGNDFSEVILGGADDNLIDGRDGDDSIGGGAGNDIFVASEGDDKIVGGAGTNMLYFDAFFSEFELSRDPDTDDIIFTHVNPPKGKKNLGSERIIQIDFVVFKDISFTKAELDSALIGASILNGTAADDLIFLNSNALTDGDPTTNLNSDGQHEANGRAGDDKIFGSTADDELNGGKGNDLFIPGHGNDEVNGNGDAGVDDTDGSDTYQILEIQGNDEVRANLTTGDVRIDTGNNDVVTSIENLIVQRSGDHYLVGSIKDNYILSSRGRDVITGDAGDDTIDGGDERDTIMGGDGEDVVLGGNGDDALIAGGASLAGVNDFYDGGDGVDLLSYAGDHNTFYEARSTPQTYRNDVKNAFENTTSNPGAIRLYGDEGRVEHVTSNGSVITTDTFANIENFQGSDQNDTIYGVGGDFAFSNFVDGGKGDDLIYQNGASTARGGSGNDTVVASASVGTGSPSAFGGTAPGDLDELVLTEIGEAKWNYKLDGSITNNMRAYNATATGFTGPTLWDGNVEEFEIHTFGNHDDRVDFKPLGNGFYEFNMEAGDDTVIARRGEITVNGGDGNDRIDYIADQNGVFNGGNGNDYAYWDTTGINARINGGAGQDHAEVRRFIGNYDGGDGFDVLAIGTFNARAFVDLEDGRARTVEVSTFVFDGELDARLSNVEGIIGTTRNDTISGSSGDDQLAGAAGNDTLSGRGGEDKLYGGDGNDSLSGGTGNDVLHGGAGDDTLNGGGGSDTASYIFAVPDNLDGSLRADNFSGVNVNLTNGSVFGNQGSDTLIAIDNVIGTLLGDRLVGNSGDNLLSGDDGNDHLIGMDGDDYLATGRGNDRAEGGNGNDTFIVDTGDKVLLGDSGTDTLDFGVVAGTFTLDFAARSYSASLKELRPVWNDTGTQESRVFGSTSSTPQQVRETEALFSNSTDDLNRNLPNLNNARWDEFRIRDASFTESYSGSWSSVERFTGGAATTILVLSANVDHFDGTRGSRDLIQLSQYGSGITYNFSTGSTNVQVLMNDQLTGVEGMYASNFNDTLTGHSGDNIFYGRGGNDRLTSAGGDDDVWDGTGNDTVSLGSGDDYVKVGGGRDRFDGGTGNDYISYFDSTGGIEIDLAAGTVEGSWAANDTVTGFEGFGGSRTGGDEVQGTNGANTIRTYGGNDRVWDRAGEDEVDLGSGNDYVRVGGGKDSFNGGSGKDWISYYDSTGGVEVDLAANTASGSWAANDTVENFESISGSGTGGDTIYGTSGSNTIKTYGGNDRVEDREGADRVELGSGNDYVKVGGGKDSFDGGSGKDYISYYDSTGGVTLNLGANTASGSWAANDTIKGFESAAGSGTGDDRIVGTNGSNTIRTYGGDDDVWDLKGDDFVELGSGDDYVKVGGGKDSFNGGSGVDYISYYDSTGGVKIDLWINTAAWSWASNDTIKGFEGVSGSGTGSDDLRGTNSDNVIRGYGGNDVIHGRGGNDKLYGGSGNDYFDTGGGNDTVWGGSGADTFHFDEDEDGDVIKDFENNIDEIEFHNIPGVNTATAALNFATQQGTDVYFDFGNGITLLVEDITKGQLANDIVFA